MDMSTTKKKRNLALTLVAIVIAAMALLTWRLAGPADAKPGYSCNPPPGHGGPGCHVTAPKPTTTKPPAPPTTKPPAPPTTSARSDHHHRDPEAHPTTATPAGTTVTLPGSTTLSQDSTTTISEPSTTTLAPTTSAQESTTTTDLSQLRRRHCRERHRWRWRRAPRRLDRGRDRTRDAGRVRLDPGRGQVGGEPAGGSGTGTGGPLRFVLAERLGHWSYALFFLAAE